MGVMDFIYANKWVLLAYLVLAIIVYLNRKKFIVENKIFLLYKTKHGVDHINNFADKNREFVKLLGLIAIGVGFVGMIFILYLFGQGVWNLLFVPEAPPTVSLVIPGVQIPGSPIKIPFVYGILSLFVVIVFHEFGHGVVARANGVKIKSTGVGLLGPLPLAFVEPDEKQLTKMPSHVQNGVFAAGPFFNALLCIIIFLLIAGFNLATTSMAEPQGFYFSNIQKGYAADIYHLEANVTYNMINGVVVKDQDGLVQQLSNVGPNDTLIIGNKDGNKTLMASTHPDNPKKGYLGITGIKTDYRLKSESALSKAAFGFLLIFSNPFATDISEYTFLQWIFILSLGIGLANLLPLGPVDGGRMLHIALVDIKGKEKGMRWWSRISWITLFVLLALLIIPILRHFLKV
jgi:membrane-associated protease RseP (regulator of RpoE activity)